MCVEENRDKREIKKTKDEKNVAEKKRGKKKCCVGYTCGVGQGHEQIFFSFSFFKYGYEKKKKLGMAI